MDNIAFALALGASFSWGLSLTVNKLCAGRINATTFNTVQYLILTAIMTPLVLMTGLVPGSTWAVLMALTYGVFWIFVGSQIFYYCLERAPAHVVVPISNTAAIWAVFFSALLLSENIGLAVPLSLPFIIIGIVLMSPKREPGKKGPRSAIILAVVVALIFGMMQTSRKTAVTDGIGATTFLWIAGLTGTSLLALTGLLRSSFRGQRLDGYSIGVSATAGLGQVVGGILYLMALALANASAVAPVTASIIPFGFLLSIPLLRERPTKKAVAGVATIFAGVVIATL
ncbi:MAG: DMT family transporter [Methanobacteriota archaeon]